MKRVLSALCTLAVAAAFTAGPVLADDEPNTAMNGKLLLVKGGKLAKFISKPVSPNVFDLPDASNEPTSEGATITFSVIGGVASLSSSLPSGGWKGLGSPAGSKGWKYTGAGSLADPCKTVLVKPKIIKAICKGAAVDLDQPVGPNTVAVALTIGTDTKAYCTQFGGTEVKNDATLLKRKDSNGIDACTCGTSAPGTFTFRNGPPTTSDCGDITTVGGVTSDLGCNGLYIGSGSGSLTLPETVPDSNKALVMDVECCTGETLLLRATTQAQTGDIETCTAQGCKFGAPLPLPNLGSPNNSTCVLNTYQKDVTGEATCNAGTARLNAPLNSATYLTGDLLPSRCVGGTNPGAFCGSGGRICLGGVCTADSDIQPCPICNPVTGRCNGGPNGMGSTGVTDTDSPCTPDGGENVAGPQFPTSHDCAPPALNLIGTLPVPFLLTTGTSTDTALPNTGGDQQRVFCGFCRDVDGTGAFGICTAGSSGVGTQCAVTGDCGVGGVCEAAPCESDAECATAGASREKCVQRNEGAFGPGGGGNMTITEIGTPSAGDLGDFAAHDATLVSAFCIPPSFNGIIDGAADIPGPGAVSLPGVMDVNSPSGAFVDGSNLF